MCVFVCGVCLCLCLRACVRACMRACVRACMLLCVCVCVCLFVCLFVCLSACRRLGMCRCAAIMLRECWRDHHQHRWFPNKIAVHNHRLH